MPTSTHCGHSPDLLAFALPGGSRMQIHLPKPLHGWRAFAGEVGIIVLGVLIALGFGQIVELVSSKERGDGGQRHYSRRAGLQSRTPPISVADQIVHRCAHLGSRTPARRSRHSTQAPATRFGSARPQYWTLQTSRWDAESQAGHAALIDRRELAEYGFIYALMRDVENEMMLEQTDWAKLRMLERLHSLDEPALADLNAAVQDARYRGWRVALISSEIFTGANELKLAATPNASPGLTLGLPRNEYDPRSRKSSEQIAVRRALKR